MYSRFFTTLRFVLNDILCIGFQMINNRYRNHLSPYKTIQSDFLF